MNEKTKNILEWVYCVVIALILAILIRYFVGTPTVVKHVSMRNTLEQNQRLILNKLPRTFGKNYQRGDIITFEAPSVSMADSIYAEYNYKPSNIFEGFGYYVLEIGKTSYIKRVIAVGGDHVELKDGKVYVNGELLKEDYIREPDSTQPQNKFLENFVVPDDYVFAMGDNRAESMDCRSFGCIPVQKIESKVWIRIWPLDKFGEVE